MGRPVPTAREFDKRDVLVGVLHNPQQLEVNLSHRFYHMPAALLLVPQEQVFQIALYQSVRHFGKEKAGVRFYGAVERIEEVARGEITEIPTRKPEERYWRFAVREWHTLEKGIRAVGKGPGVSMTTTRFLLHHSRYFPELYITTPEQHLVYSYLRGACAHTLQKGGSVKIPANAGYTVLVSGWTIGVYTPDGSCQTHQFRRFYYEPHSFLQRMMGYVNIQALRTLETANIG